MSYLMNDILEQIRESNELLRQLAKEAKKHTLMLAEGLNVQVPPDDDAEGELTDPGTITPR